MWITGFRRSALFSISIPTAAFFAFSCIARTVSVGEPPGGLESLEIVDHNDLV